MSDNETPMVVDVASVLSTRDGALTCPSGEPDLYVVLQSLVDDARPDEAPALRAEVARLKAELELERHRKTHARKAFDVLTAALGLRSKERFDLDLVRWARHCAQNLSRERSEADAERAAHDATRKVCSKVLLLVDRVADSWTTDDAELLDEAAAALRKAAEPPEMRTDRAPIVTPK